MKKQYKILYWTPRAICILAILLVSIFAWDAFDSNLTIWQQIVGFLIHLVPSFVLLGLLLVAWKYEYVGGIILVIIGLILSFIVFRMNFRMNHSVWMSIGIITAITLPFVIAGALFMIHHSKIKSLGKN